MKLSPHKVQFSLLDTFSFLFFQKTLLKNSYCSIQSFFAILVSVVSPAAVVSPTAQGGQNVCLFVVSQTAVVSPKAASVNYFFSFTVGFVGKFYKMRAGKFFYVSTEGVQ